MAKEKHLTEKDLTKCSSVKVRFTHFKCTASGVKYIGECNVTERKVLVEKDKPLPAKVLIVVHELLHLASYEIGASEYDTEAINVALDYIDSDINSGLYPEYAKVSLEDLKKAVEVLLVYKDELRDKVLSYFKAPEIKTYLRTVINVMIPLKVKKKLKELGGEK